MSLALLRAAHGVRWTFDFHFMFVGALLTMLERRW
jgi:hypothetical protein